MALRRRGSLPFGADSANRPDGEGMSQQFPLVYRMSRAGRIFNFTVGIIALVLSLGGAAYFAFVFDADATGPIFALICLLFALLAVPCIGAPLRVRVQVFADALEARFFIRQK